MKQFSTKTDEEIVLMAKGGRLLGRIRDRLAAAVKPGVTGLEIENLACRLIDEAGGKASFKMVPGYSHATCVNVNDVVVHGIPDNYVFKSGDKVGIDVGLFMEGFHTDTSTTVIVGQATPEQLFFLETGKKALNKAIEMAKPGRRISDISMAMQKTIEEAGFATVKALTGHGIGRNLHEEPAIPCFVMGNRQHSPTIQKGMVIAIEIMYNMGTDDVQYKNDDGWTIVTADGKISGLFEQTVAVTESGPAVLTK